MRIYFYCCHCWIFLSVGEFEENRNLEPGRFANLVTFQVSQAIKEETATQKAKFSNHYAQFC